MRKIRNFAQIVTSENSSLINASVVEVVKLGLVDRISSSSYISKNRVFLDDKEDGKLFMDTLLQRGVENIMLDRQEPKKVRVTKYPAYTPELAMERYNALTAVAACAVEAPIATTEEPAPVAAEPETTPEPVVAEEPAPVVEEEAPKAEEPKKKSAPKKKSSTPAKKKSPAKKTTAKKKAPAKKSASKKA